MKAKTLPRSLLALLLVLLMLTVSACSSQQDSSSSETSGEASSESSASSATSSSESSSESSENIPPEVEPNPLYVPTDIPLDETLPQKLADAQEESDAVVGWIQIPGMIIDYPVAQGEDNSFYLSHNYKGEDSSNGSIYVHRNNDLSDVSHLPRNTVIFGHNMWVYTDEMFTTLEDFYELDFAKEHQYVTLTIGDTTTYWLIYAVFDTVIANDDTQYDFYYWNTYNQTEDEWTNVQAGIRERSLYQYDVDVAYEDNTLILSTCSYHYRNWLGFLRDDIRLVVAARLVHEGENLGDVPLPALHEGRLEPA